MTVKVYAMAIVDEAFPKQQQQQSYEQLTQELRCLVCQNQNLADSDADLAKDLRQEIAQQLRSGKSKTEVVDFLVERYGEFIRYQPTVN